MATAKTGVTTRTQAYGLPPVRRTVACGMRELPEEDKPLVVGMMISGLLGMIIPKAQEPRLLVLNLVRLTDHAIREHAAARRVLMRHVAQGAATDLFECFGHLEACIGATRRALQCLHQLKRFREVRVDKTLRRLVEGFSDSVQAVRHTIEHMDERIANGEITLAERPWPVLNSKGDRMTIGSDTMLFSRLASTLSGLWRVADRLSNVRYDPRVTVNE